MLTVTHTLYTEDGEDGEEVIEFPARYEVCGRCGGEGKHVNPSIDGPGGLGQEDFDADPDFEEAYFSGVYDVVCHECKGQRVVKVAVLDRFTDEQKAQWAELQKQWEDDAADRALERMERMMGA